ncbi:MAG TPA: glycine--tRNA ligase subunit beta [Bryobacteraceae bacterium]|jgi:glycyl-tRNA synthetase beta chain|nr:glycine--tRNA ligase subunit beta [Bryobacteraceae bacterium]
MPDLLVEIGTEEIPDWMIEPALADWKSKFEAAFGSFGGSAIQMDATPRRLVLRARDLQAQAADTENVVLGPYLSAGAKAAEGFARKWNTSLDALQKTADAKGERYVFHQLTKGQTARAALEDKLPGVIASISFPKTMSWPGSAGVRFIRPIRWIVALLDDEVLNFEVAGVKASNKTRGHRVLGAKEPVAVTIADYERMLEQNGVIVKAAERERRIRAALGADVQSDDELVATLVYLTEFPSVIRGRFDESYLSLPKEILSTVMRHHQKYFSVVKADGSLAAEFVAVTNTNGDPDGLIRQGNERVLRARFNDARFFWEADQKKKLADRVGDLGKITFQAKLGSYEEKTKRVVAVAEQLARDAGADLETVKRAALLLKCDLTTDMVKEFTELQGVVGGLYARAQGESANVADAIYDQYKPVSMEDSIPRSREAQVVAIADKLDTLRECFRIGLIPTGSKDPFALRRAAQGIVKILFEARPPLPILQLVADVNGLADFLRERIQFYLRDVLGFAYDEVNAVLAAGVTTLGDVHERVKAVHEIRPTEDFEPVAASFKRIQNILKQAGVNQSAAINEILLQNGPERELYDAFQNVRNRVASGADYRSRLEAMASLRPQVDRFFDKILVNDPDPAIRQNRLALLHSLLTEFSTIADFSEIVTQRGSGIAV